MFTVATKTLAQYTHIILDEVHERNQDMDFLLLIIKMLLPSAPLHVKIILMSATFDIPTFTNYFESSENESEAVSLKVEPKNPMYTTKVFYTSHLSKFEVSV